jgi:K+-sensing histidine kinase KdpD
VVGTTELLRDTALDAEQREYVDIARSAAEGLVLVINDILDYSTLEADKIELEMRDISLRETVAEACSVVTMTARSKGIALNAEIGPTVPAWLRGDGTRIRQVLVNLLSNAVKFTDRGAVSIRVSATPLESRTRVRVEVADTGVGIDPAALARLFQPFTQADNTTTRRYGGTGLGLTISAQLIASMGSGSVRPAGPAGAARSPSNWLSRPPVTTRPTHAPTPTLRRALPARMTDRRRSCSSPRTTRSTRSLSCACSRTSATRPTWSATAPKPCGPSSAPVTPPC